MHIYIEKRTSSPTTLLKRSSLVSPFASLASPAQVKSSTSVPTPPTAVHVYLSGDAFRGRLLQKVRPTE